VSPSQKEIVVARWNSKAEYPLNLFDVKIVID
jgi:hypothetical protein